MLHSTLTETNDNGFLVPHTKLPVTMYTTPGDTNRAVAGRIASVIRRAQEQKRKAVLLLSPGSTPQGVYRELVRLYAEEGLDFSEVIFFVSLEFYGLSKDRPQSIHASLHANLFEQINTPADQIHIPDSQIELSQMAAYCKEFDQLIHDAGGIDFALLGFGSNGHIAGNEPFSESSSRTHMCVLDPVTRVCLASEFFGEENVPTQAITMGLGTIMESREVAVMALGEHKASVVSALAEGPVTNKVPVSLFQDHGNTNIYLDSASAGCLEAIATPWTLGSVDWKETMVIRALVWLSEQTEKSLLKLDDDDFRNHNLHQLLRHHGPSHLLARRVFNLLQGTICDQVLESQNQTVICFSPHPDDDVISMGGTLIRLNEEGHQTHIAYMTSGNIAVFDDDAQRIADLVTEYNHLFGIENEKSIEVERRVADDLKNKKAGHPDSDAVLKIKGLIRWSEAKAGAIVAGCKEEYLHFLDLPFYRTGRVKKNPIGEADISIIVSLMETVEPDLIFVAGDLSDPHGTHRICAEAIFNALEVLQQRGKKVPQVLLYRGAWHEYAIHEIDLSVPLSPGHQQTKREAIFKHESQKDEALFPGSDPREFWERAEDRNKATAKQFNNLGLPEFPAVEAFQRWNGQKL
ncbi:MAG: glucosamine-6-phosphate deaminase [Planctomycetaceae bacterium]|nr:glucosamine-6-phosphate deaminase [Planctomycetaceae bacterium]|tara:strand:- start:2339 stop:4237 length:1899 start_codon:yes stop_codon:yes gene_type:complete